MTHAYHHCILCKNEADIIARTVEWHLCRGFVSVFDNSSTDTTLKELEPYTSSLTFSLDSQKGNFHPSRIIRNRVAQKATPQVDALWFGFGDADEHWNVDAPWLREIAAQGHNVISMPMRFFWPTDPNGQQPHEMRHYSWSVAWLLKATTPHVPSKEASARKEIHLIRDFKRYINSHQAEMKQPRNVYRTDQRVIDHYMVRSWPQFVRRLELWREVLRLPRPHLKGKRGWHVGQWIKAYDKGAISKKWWEEFCERSKELPTI